MKCTHVKLHDENRLKSCAIQQNPCPFVFIVLQMVLLFRMTNIFNALTAMTCMHTYNLSYCALCKKLSFDLQYVAKKYVKVL